MIHTPHTRWIQLRNAARLNYIFSDIYELYDQVDPDDDDDPPNVEMLEGYMFQFRKKWRVLLDRADFEVLSPEFIDKAFSESNTTSGGLFGSGLEVQRVDSNIVEYKVYYRSNTVKTVKYRSWRTLFFQGTAKVHMFERMVIVYRRRPDEHIAYLEALHPKSTIGKVWSAFFNWAWNIKALSPATLSPGNLYIKLFKNVANTDIDMMLPGAMPKFSWLDYALIWGGLLIALAVAIWKATQGTLRFNGDDYVVIATSVILIIMPLLAAAKGYLSVKDKLNNLHLHLANLFIRHNMSSNTGVIASILDEAQSQEDKEAVLAYFFLWRGNDKPEAMTKEEIDHMVEHFLISELADEATSLHLDFDIDDALSKLVRMGIVTESSRAADKVYTAMSLDQAVEFAHLRHFDEAKEVLGCPPRLKLKTTNDANAGVELTDARELQPDEDGPVWQECIGTYPSTGQRFRYFFNSTTGESTYTVPEGMQVVPLSEEAAREAVLAPTPEQRARRSTPAPPLPRKRTYAQPAGGYRPHK
ncbi:hypothetical protein FOA52_001025 [Chlamydomonas sp. UWO 241]|nr:hypothetical protein FOA52_001025 [Chlamydomonas sp. UWO 241]